MSSPYVGEIRMFAGNFAPVGWMFCQGQILPISENETLFNLIGTTYGGDGQSTFALPDLSSRIPLHFGSLSGTPFTLGESGGVETVTLTSQQVPAHSHSFLASSSNGSQTSPEGNVLAASFGVTPYINDVPTGSLSLSAVGAAGGSQPHDNMQPFLCVNFIISLFGIFPTPT